MPDDDERTHAVERLLRDGVDPHAQLGRNALLDAEFPELAALLAERS